MENVMSKVTKLHPTETNILTDLMWGSSGRQINSKGEVNKWIGPICREQVHLSANRVFTCTAGG